MSVRRDLGVHRRAVHIAGWLALAFGLTHAVNHVLRGETEDLLWVCNVAPLVLALGCLLARPTFVAVPLLWLSFGTPMWLVDLATGGEVIWTSIPTHVGCPLLALFVARKLGFPRSSWLYAAGGLAALMLLCRLVTPRASNVNLAFDVWAGWQDVFPTYGPYFALLFAGSTATFFVFGRLYARLLGSGPAEVV